MPLIKSYLTLLILLVLTALSPLYAQQVNLEQQQASRDYFMANQLIRQDRHEDALSLLLPLVERFPTNFSYFDRALECYIQLKSYTDALKLIENREKLGLPSFEYNIKRGYLYHLQGDTVKARTLWDAQLASRPNQVQFYRSLGETLTDRREYSRVILTYKTAREIFGDDTIFLFEMAQVLRISGRYDGAVAEYMTFLKRYPERLSMIQRQFSQFNDENFYDIAIVEIEELTRPAAAQNTAWFVAYRELLIWLYNERKQYRRSYLAARDLELRGISTTAYQYNLSRLLRDQKEFELASSALQHYHTHDKALNYLKALSYDELAQTYMEWHAWLQKNNLETLAFRDSLSELARGAWGMVLNNFPDYEKTDQVVSALAQLELDAFYDVEKAQRYTDRLKQSRNTERSQVIAEFLQGRIALFNKNYNEARRHFTRANKQARIGEWADKTRYYLILTDFFTHDYEFAQIQMKALEKQHTSLMVNDVLRLRTFLQDGLSEDSVHTVLNDLSSAMEELKRGERLQAYERLTKAIETHADHPLTDDMMLVMNEFFMTEQPAKVFATTHRYLQSKESTFSKHRERLMWDRAVAAERYWTQYRKGFIASKPAVDQLLFSGKADFSLDELIQQPTQLLTFYENLILDFPQGFYPDLARSAIQRLERTLETL